MQFIKIVLALIFGLPLVLFLGVFMWGSLQLAWATPFGKVVMIGIALAVIIAFVRPFLSKRTIKRITSVKAWKLVIPFIFAAGVIKGFVLEIRDIVQTEA